VTQVRLIGLQTDAEENLDLFNILMAHETPKQILSLHNVTIPFENSIDISTISLGSSLSLLNDLRWYLSRYVSEVLILEPSVDEKEWLSRKLATSIRNNELSIQKSKKFLKIYSIISVSGVSKLDPPIFVSRKNISSLKPLLNNSNSTMFIRLLSSEFGSI
tara:strand:- start:356 stop:838 length:483 start_codon:yes stop_codon:yes gene_type:complete